MNQRDLFVVVADLDAENVVRTLLQDRQEAFGIRLTFDAQPYPKGDLLRYSGRDAGCRKNAVDLLRPVRTKYRHALLMFDLHGSGVENRDRETVEVEIEQRFAENGWEPSRARVIVIAPEIEAWVWSPSPQVSQILGWPEGPDRLRQHLAGHGFWDPGDQKPRDPKNALREATRNRARLTARVFGLLSREIGFRDCQDPAFAKLRSTLCEWFPA